jgi:UDP-glucose 4-epimerase
VSCFVFTSSIAVYGNQTPPMTETMFPHPEDPYGVAKFAVEQDLKTAHDMFGLNYVIFRPHNVYGEYQNIGDRYRNVVGIFMNQILKQQPLTVFGDGTQTRAFSYIGDIAPAIAHCVEVKEAYNQVFNIGAQKDYSVNELTKTIMLVMGKSVDMRYLEARNEVAHAYSDHAKAERILGVKSETSLHDGLAKMVAWVSKVGAKKSKSFEGIEIMEKLPAIWLED